MALALAVAGRLARRAATGGDGCRCGFSRSRSWPSSRPREVHHDRFVVPALGVIALCAGDAARRLGGRWTWAIAVVAALGPLWASGDYVRGVRQPSTRDLAVDWINANVPAGASIVTTLPDLGVPRDRYRVLPILGLDRGRARLLAEHAAAVVTGQPIADEEVLRGLRTVIAIEPLNRHTGLRLVVAEPLRPARYEPVDLRSAVVTVSEAPERVRALFDGDAGTSWMTAGPQGGRLDRRVVSASGPPRTDRAARARTRPALRTEPPRAAGRARRRAEARAGRLRIAADPTRARARAREQLLIFPPSITSRVRLSQVGAGGPAVGRRRAAHRPAHRRARGVGGDTIHRSMRSVDSAGHPAARWLPRTARPGVPHEVRGVWVVRTALASPQARGRRGRRGAPGRGQRRCSSRCAAAGDAFYDVAAGRRAATCSRDQPEAFDPLERAIARRARAASRCTRGSTSCCRRTSASACRRTTSLARHPDWVMQPRRAAQRALCGRLARAALARAGRRARRTTSRGSTCRPPRRAWPSTSRRRCASCAPLSGRRLPPRLHPLPVARLRLLARRARRGSRARWACSPADPVEPPRAASWPRGTSTGGRVLTRLVGAAVGAARVRAARRPGVRRRGAGRGDRDPATVPGLAGLGRAAACSTPLPDGLQRRQPDLPAAGRAGPRARGRSRAACGPASAPIVSTRPGIVEKVRIARAAGRGGRRPLLARVAARRRTSTGCVARRWAPRRAARSLPRRPTRGPAAGDAPAPAPRSCWGWRRASRAGRPRGSRRKRRRSRRRARRTPGPARRSRR